MTLKMLAAYYSRGQESKDIFEQLMIGNQDNFCEYMNHYDVIVLNMQEFLSNSRCIDEWDCIFREYKDKVVEQGTYLDFLRNWLKDKPYVELAYMTGILPIKKYGTHSALNMFTEYSMANPRQFSEFVGFTEEEVKELCKKIQHEL